MKTSMIRDRGPLFVCLLLTALAACTESPTTPADTAILVEPADQSVLAGATATFAVTASNATSYEWQSATAVGAPFSDIPGATNASYTTAATVLADHGRRYRVIVTGAGNSDTSAVATLSVTAAPVAPAITAHPAAQVISAGSDAVFSVTATGTALTYQWQRSTNGGGVFSDLAGATSATLTRTAVPIGDNGHLFRVIVGNTLGSVTSNTALLTVGPAPAIPTFSANPADQSVFAPATATFTVAAGGVPAPTLQWQVSTGGAFTNIPGATGTVYTTAATSGADHGNRYRAVATNASGSATSTAATLNVTVPAAPAFTQHPQNVSVEEGQSPQLTVVVTGLPTPTLQWQASTDGGAVWNDLAGATGTTLSLPAVALSASGNRYRAVASNGVGAPVNSNAAILTVTAPPAPLTIVTTSPLPAGLTNVPYSFTLNATGGVGPYTWSDPAGSLPSGWTLNPSTGQISGVPTVQGTMRWTIRVTDSANPPQTHQRDFDVAIELNCEFGSATVANAPPTVEGRFCPTSVNPPEAPNNGFVSATWIETYPYGGGSYREVVSVNFNAETGGVQSVSFFLNDPTRTIFYLCLLVGSTDYPQCGGVSVNLETKIIRFENTLVGSGTSPGYTLNGELRY